MPVDDPICLILVLIVLSPGNIAQLVTCLATDACLTAYPEIASRIPAQSHTFVEIDRERFSSLLQNHTSRVVVRYKVHKYWLTACSSLPRKKCG